MHLPRSSGTLLHITSLPGPYGIGDLGPNAFRFADFLAETHQRVWQVLPVVPVGYGYSPYASPSTFAGNPLLISPDVLHARGLLTDEDLANRPDFPVTFIDFERARPYKRHLLERAYDRFKTAAPDEMQAAFDAFCAMHSEWLENYALFMSLKEAFGEIPWVDWPKPLAHRHPDALAEARIELARAIEMHTFWQFLFAQQWDALHNYCRQRNIVLFGDLPIYVAHDSADVWGHPDLFYLEDDGNPMVVSGVPPDYFSATGQRWGNPLYRWDRMRENGYRWWARRFQQLLAQVDVLRLDHFRGFAAYWEIPAHENTAINGRWVQGPGPEFFQAIEAQLGRLPLVAENLGIITEDVDTLMKHFGFPGMAVLQFAFESGTDAGFLPHSYNQALVAYTGSHDNNTIVGWWHQNVSTRSAEATAKEQNYAKMYLNMNGEREHEIHWTCIRTLMASVANWVIFPVQDLLGLGSEARMNTPGAEKGNWGWRLHPDALTPDIAFRLRTITRIYDRSEDKTLPV